MNPAVTDIRHVTAQSQRLMTAGASGQSTDILQVLSNILIEDLRLPAIEGWTVDATGVFQPITLLDDLGGARPRLPRRLLQTVQGASQSLIRDRLGTLLDPITGDRLLLIAIFAGTDLFGVLCGLRNGTERAFSGAELATARLYSMVASTQIERCLAKLVPLGDGRSFDPLTGLHTRSALETYLQTTKRRPLWLFHIDIDRFRRINEDHGHSIGDAVLIDVARRLSHLATDLGFAARLGGDAFALVVEEAPELDPEHLGRDLLHRLGRSKVTSQIEVELSCAIGAVQVIDASASASLAMQQCELALAEAKGRAAPRFAVFSAELTEKLERRKSLQADVQLEEFVPFFQPLVFAQSRELAGLEVLARWQPLGRALISPADFMPMLEETGRLSQLDGHLSKRALTYQRAWLDTTGQLIPLSLNISADRLADPELLSQIRRLDRRHRALSLELLETIYLDDAMGDFTEAIHEIRNLGVEVELDDFGTGQTSLLAMSELRPNRIKLDKRLVAPAITSASARGVVKSIVDLALSLGISVTAEGIESPEMARLMTELGCHRLQGFHFAKPMAEADLKRTLPGWKAPPHWAY